MPKLHDGIELFQLSEYSQAFDILFPFAEEGNAEAQSLIANIYHLGLGTDRDINKAIYWYGKSAAQDHVIALNNLANIFLTCNQECLIDTNKAVSLYRKAAELGFAPSQYFLGKMYLEGIGVDVDQTEAIKWLNFASANNFQPAKTMICSILHSDKSN
jgi:uncharacterized protein